MRRPSGGLVYSTAKGRMCPDCRCPVDVCACRRAPPVPTGDGVVRVARETKGRKGKGVTLVTGVPLAGEALTALGAELKRRCGTGGTVKDGVIELQGDHRDAVVAALGGRGWTIKRAGG